ncbi:MAG: SDR family NAD(P)-dependent oxidoreductase [Chitinophagaceae bacterium]|nr:SDR family NAD(P)-dependent oxidoreductase [Chitinophagaceae bacterium]
MVNKTALITGASEGLGREFAKQLVTNGYNITAVARNENKLKQLVNEIGNNHSYIVADLTTVEGQDKIVQTILEQHFDLLINNAGIGAVGKFTELPLEKYEEVLTLNIQTVVKLSYAYLKTAKAGDALINVSSSLAFMPMPAVGLYAVTKAFVTSFSESLWYEQKSRGVYVMGLCPGIISTNFNTNAGGGVNKAPKMMTQTPEQVVSIALKALESRKKPTVLSVFTDRLFAFLFRFYSRKAIVSTMGKMGSKT